MNSELLKVVTAVFETAILCLTGCNVLNEKQPRMYQTNLTLHFPTFHPFGKHIVELRNAKLKR